jgi:hypothetical protein
MKGKKGWATYPVTGSGYFVSALRVRGTMSIA